MIKLMFWKLFIIELCRIASGGIRFFRVKNIWCMLQQLWEIIICLRLFRRLIIYVRSMRWFNDMCVLCTSLNSEDIQPLEENSPQKRFKVKKCFVHESKQGKWEKFFLRKTRSSFFFWGRICEAWNVVIEKIQK